MKVKRTFVPPNKRNAIISYFLTEQFSITILRSYAKEIYIYYITYEGAGTKKQIFGAFFLSFSFYFPPSIPSDTYRVGRWVVAPKALQKCGIFDGKIMGSKKKSRSEEGAGIRETAYLFMLRVDCKRAVTCSFFAWYRNWETEKKKVKLLRCFLSHGKRLLIKVT